MKQSIKNKRCFLLNIVLMLLYVVLISILTKANIKMIGFNFVVFLLMATNVYGYFYNGWMFLPYGAGLKKGSGVDVFLEKAYLFLTLFAYYGFFAIVLYQYF